MPISGSSSANPPNQTTLMLAALMGGVAGRFGASLAISLEGALASLSNAERLFSISENATPEVTAGTPKVVTAVAPEGEAVDAAAKDATNTLEDVPDRVQSRVNLANDGMDHLASRHLSGKANASQFSIEEPELRSLLQSEEVVSTPITRTIDSADGVRYVREVDIGHSIGVDKFSGGQPTSVMTVMTDKFGNLVTAFPGVLK